MAVERIAELKEKLQAAKSFIQDTSARHEREKQLLQHEIEENEKFFEGMCARAKTDIEDIERQLKAEIKNDRDNWEQWSDAELIQRWEGGDFNYEHFKDESNAQRLQLAYFSYYPDVEPQPINKIVFVSAQVGAGWYKTPKEVPSWNRLVPKSTPATLTDPSKDALPKNNISQSEFAEHLRSLPRLTQYLAIL